MTAASPVTIGSYGTGRATLNAGDGFGLFARNVSGFAVQDLNFVGTWNALAATGTNAAHGIARGREFPIARLAHLEDDGAAFCEAIMTVDLRHNVVAGFSNPLFPGRPLRRGSLRPGVVRRCLAPAGAWTIERFVTMPDQRCPAYILPAARRQELDYLLRTLFVPYTDKDGWRAQAIRRGLAAMRSVTLASPAPIRSLFAPAIAVVARRSS